MRNVIDEQEILCFKQELKMLQIENTLQKRVNDIMASVNQLIKLEDLPRLGQKLDDLRQILNDQFYKKNEETTTFLANASKTFNTLVSKHKLMDEIKTAWKGFDLPFSPDFLDSLKASLLRMENLKQESINFDGAFTAKDDEKLAKCKKDVEELERNVKQREETHAELKAALEKRSYEDLKRVLKTAKNTTFLDDKLVSKCEKLRDFLNPKERKAALTDACKRRDIKAIEKAIEDFKAANVTRFPDELAKAEKRLKKLKHIEKLNKLLRRAMVDREIDALREALQTCKEDRIHNSDIPLFSEAQELLTELTIDELKENLSMAVESRNLPQLVEALQAIQNSG